MRTAIIGAGVSGLSLALLLDGEVDVFEASETPGGHASTTIRGGWTYDQGPHIMFSKDRAILDFMIASLRGNVHRSRRNSRVCIDGRFVKYPIENDLGSLPEDLRNECLLGYLFNEKAHLADDPGNLRDWFAGVFGEPLTALYFQPYNEKIWKTPIEQLSMSWAERIPRPPPVDVVKGALGISTEGYTHQLHFHYPRTGGYEAIPRAWTGMLHPSVVHLGAPVRALRPMGDGVELDTALGPRRYDRVVSTVPLHVLLELVDGPVPEGVTTAASGLRINPMAAVTLGFRGIDEHQFSSVYFPQPEFLVNRISSPCTFSPLNGPEGCFSIQAEITVDRPGALDQWSDQFLVDHCVDGLLANLVVSPHHDLIFSDVQRFPHAYVVYTQGYEAGVATVKDWAASWGVHLHGRFGAFEYLNVDGCVARSVDLATALNRRRTSLADVCLEVEPRIG